VITAERKHHHKRVNQDRESAWWGKFKTWGWRHAGEGKYYKRRLHKAHRQWYKARLRGQRGKEPTDLESEVNWKGW
jgi:hypothetical protein